MDKYIDRARYIIKLASKMGVHISGPVETAYGFGWDPTVTIWKNNRRMHFYYGILSTTKDTIEVAIHHSDCSNQKNKIKNHSEVQYCTYQNDKTTWLIAKHFFIDCCSLNELPQADWQKTSDNQDTFIPHPPDEDNPGNIVQLIDNM